VLSAAACTEARRSTVPTRRRPSTTTATGPTPTTGLSSVTNAVPTSSPDSSLDVAELRGVSGGQAVVVRSVDYGQTTALLTTYRRVVAGWRLVAGPWPAFVGRSGTAPPGEKREGDLRTPSGVYGFDFAFGVQPNPGLRLAFRRVTDPNIVWDDDPASPLYNEWVDLSQQPAGVDPEPMFTSPAYDLGAVIAYNSERTPGLGSAIFLHVSTGQPTAGCVSLPVAQLRAVLRWLDPAQTPVIAIGVG